MTAAVRLTGVGGWASNRLEGAFACVNSAPMINA